MAKDSLFAKDEIEANRNMSLGCLAAAGLLLILWICYLTGVFPIRNSTLIMVTFPINIVLLISPILFVRTKFVEKPGFKFFVLTLFALVVALVNVVIPKHGILGWAALIALASHYRSPKMLWFMTLIAVALMAICLIPSMLMGEWDANLLGISDLDFQKIQVGSDGHLGNPDNMADRLWWLQNYTSLESRASSTNRFLSAYAFYFSGRVLSLVLVSIIMVNLCNRNKKLLYEESRVLTEKNKIDADLSVAANIQLQALPQVFPEVEEFDVYATMQPAKEVGGDFYDLYKPGPTRLCFTIGDVSGKGVPAALFMMKAKTLMKTLSCAGQSVEKVMEHSNWELLQGNEQGMFVTSITSTLDLKNGQLIMSNAGHNPPLLKHYGKTFEYLKLSKGFVLAGLEDVIYKSETINLEPGDTIFLYTDGVTEAMNVKGELYGEARLRDFLNTLPTVISSKDACDLLKEDLEKFVGEAPQADDITMLMLTYVGPDANEIVVDGTRENVDVVTDYIREKLQDKQIDRKIIAQINVAVDELYSNIAQYAYGGEIGKVTVQVRFFEEYLAITFIDSGKPFNPLEKDDPDVTLDAEDRGIGGLGIFIVKKTMDKVIYNYVDGQNMLTIAKIIQ